ncbi:MAG: hypothetical protein ACLP6E_05795 [Acidimicrobiales bacterium]
MTTLQNNALAPVWSRARIWLDQPWCAAAVAVVAATLFVVLRLYLYAHGDLTRFIDAGSSFVNASRAPHGLHIVSGTGYDGEFYYRLALNPSNLHRSAYGITFDSAYRLQRITYSAIAWLVSGGRWSFVPTALVIVNIVGLGVIAWLAAVLSKDAKRLAIWGLLVAGYFGFLFTLGRDLTEICAACFLLAGILALRRDRFVLGGILLTAAALSRETALAFAIAFGILCVVEIVRRRRPPGRKDAAWLVPGVVFAVWQAVGWSVYGASPLRSDAGDNLGTPLVAMFGAIGHFVWTLPNAHSAIWLGELVVLATIVVLAGMSLRDAGVRNWETLAWGFAVLVVLCLGPGIWRGEADFRGFQDLYVLSGVVLLGSRRSLALPAALIAAAWAVTFVHRTLFF